MRKMTAERYEQLCLQKGIALSAFIIHNLGLLLRQSRFHQPHRISHWKVTVKELFPRTGRSDPDAQYRFDRPVDSIPIAVIEAIHRTTRSAKKFREMVLAETRVKASRLPAIRRVTHKMIQQRIEDKWGKSFTRADVLSLLFRVQFPELETGPMAPEYDSIPETDLWWRILHRPFSIEGRLYQACIGVGKDGSKRVELIAFNPDQGFAQTECFFYMC